MLAAQLGPDTVHEPDDCIDIGAVIHGAGKHQAGSRCVLVQLRSRIVLHVDAIGDHMDFRRAAVGLKPVSLPLAGYGMHVAGSEEPRLGSFQQSSLCAKHRRAAAGLGCTRL